MKIRISILALFLICFVSVLPPAGGQQKAPTPSLSAEELNKLLPASVFLDGQNVPVQRRNSVGARLADGKLLIVTFLETSGYSADYQGKYVGIVLAQAGFHFGNTDMKPGAYGLGTKKTTAGGTESQTFHLYDLGGNSLASAPAEKDEKLKPVRTIHLAMDAGHPSRLYLGPYFVTLTAK